MVANTKHSHRLAARISEVFLSGKWIANTNYKDLLSNMSLDRAACKLGSLNSIAALTWHVNYYLAGILNVLEGGSLYIRDQYSFNHPEFVKEKDWENLKNELWSNAEKFASLIEAMDDHKLEEIFIDEKYGSYQRNIEGMIEHGYYHLGQISLIRKMIMESNKC